MSDSPGSDSGSTLMQTDTVVCSDDSTTLAQDGGRTYSVNCDQVSKTFYRNKQSYYDCRATAGSNLDRKVSSPDEEGSDQISIRIHPHPLKV